MGAERALEERGDDVDPTVMSSEVVVEVAQQW